MQSLGREPSMEDILASIKKVIAEEKELRTSAADDAVDRMTTARRGHRGADEDVLELDEPLGTARSISARRCSTSRSPARAARRSSSCRPSPRRSPPRPHVNPLEEMVREMLRPMLKQWLDEHLPQMVDEHVKREITRITGRPL